jgi:dTDP-4-dehydrorhamnose reductase
MKKILMIGSGLLGSKLAGIVVNEFTMLTTYKEHPPTTENYKSYYLDIINERDVTVLIKKLNPNYIIHTAALTDVDHCERDKRLAWNINVEGTKHIAEASKETGAKLIYISTDYVFDGEKGMYKENDPTNPIDYYGKTKLQGEKVVNGLRDYIIVRPSVLYGADNLAELILTLIEKEECGIFHLSGSERISRFDFALKIAKIFDLNTDLIKPIASDQLNWIAKRPMDSSLDVTKISKIRKPLNIEEALTRMRHMP